MSSSTGRGSSEYLHTLVGAQPSSILNYHFFVYLHSLRDTSHATILLPVRPNECLLSCQELLWISTLQKLHVQKKVSSPAFLLGSGALVTYFYKVYFFLDWSVLCRNGSSTSNIVNTNSGGHGGETTPTQTFFAFLFDLKC